MVGLIITQEEWSAGQLQWELISTLLDVYEKYVLGHEILEDGSAVLTEPSPAAISELPRQVLRSLPGVDDAFIWNMDRSLSAAKAKKKRRDLFRDAMKSLHARFKPNSDSSVHTEGPLHTAQSTRFRSKKLSKVSSRQGHVDVSGVNALFNE